MEGLLYFSVLSLVFLAPYTTGQSSCMNEGTLRLDSTTTFTSSTSGRLEICYCTDTDNCTWSTISTASNTVPWSWKNIQVACRQLARDNGDPFTGVGQPILFISEVDYASDSIDIYPDSFNCDGTELDLVNCRRSPLNPSFLNHRTDTFITCSQTAFTTDLKLTGSIERHRGILEMYLNSTGRWETICNDNFDNNVANVACKTMGYENGTSLPFVSTSTLRGNQINTPAAILRIDCTGSEKDIDSCFFSRNGSCSTSTLAGVHCIPSHEAEGDTRLYTVSTYFRYSRVEVLYSGRWGTVCNNSWNIEDGQVICRELGRSVNDTEIPSSINEFLPVINSQRPIWVSMYTCLGSEDNLTLCNQSLPTGYAPFCTHFDDAGLYCGVLPSPGGGLSGGAIAGIVIGVLVFVLCCVAVIVLAIWKGKYIKKCVKPVKRTFTLQHSRRRRRPSPSLPVVQSELTEDENHTEDENQRELTEKEVLEEELKHAPKDPELTKEKPPSYSDAAKLVAPPYPDISTDPAYPPNSD